MRSASITYAPADIRRATPVYIKGADVRFSANDESGLSDVAKQLGRQAVLSDKGLFAAWLDFQENEREWSQHFGSVSTWELFTLVLFNKGATDVQRRAACDEIARRYLEQESESVIAAAKKASLP